MRLTNKMAAPRDSSSDEVFGSLALFEEFSTTVESVKHRKIEKDHAWDDEKKTLEAKIAQLQQENILFKRTSTVCDMSFIFVHVNC